MWMKNARLKCDLCGKFMGWNNYYVWSPYGNTCMEEPPDEEHAHKECYEAQKDGGLLIRNTSYIKPQLITI